jgi:DNA-binding GntR family transcriptional regulator
MSSAKASRPAEHGTLSTVNRVIVAVKDGIRTGRYAPGQRLSEPELIRALKVSRASVREGLRLLASGGFVEQKPFAGVSIRKMSRKEVFELSQVRELLEGLAASLAARNVTSPVKKKFTDLERAYRTGTFESYADYNSRFHGLIMETSAHPHLPAFLERTQLEILRLQFARVLNSNSAVTRSHAEHDEVLKAILKGDGKAAERAMHRHVHNSTKAILESPDDYFQL